MNKKTLIKTKENHRTLYHAPLSQTRADGVTAVLVGYRRNGRDHWYGK